MEESSDPMMEPPRNPSEALSQAEEMAIRAHQRLESMGLVEKMAPLKLPNKRGATGLVFASICSIAYGLSGFMNGYTATREVPSNEYFVVSLDYLTIIAIITGIIAVCCIALGFLKKYAVRGKTIAAVLVLLMGPIILHILGTALGILL